MKSAAVTSPPDPILSLVPPAAQGDRAAFERLVRLLYPRIRRMAYKWCLSDADADDIAQESLIKLGQGIRHFREHAAFHAWLHRLVLNCIRDWGRVRQRIRARDASIEDADTVESGSDPERIATAREALKRLDRLSEPLREAIWLVSALGVTQAEAAEILGCATGTVGWRIVEARKQLLAMERMDDDEGRVRA